MNLPARRWDDGLVRAVLTVVGGLPATGKSTIAALVAERSRTPYLRVDRIEQTLVDWSPLTHPVGPVGYAVAHAVALEQLRLGLDVIVECVNPSAVTRDGWVATAAAADAGLVEVEVVCPDPEVHRRRVESRTTDVEGLVKPEWDAVVARAYEPWSRPHVTIDSTVLAPHAGADRIIAAVEAARPQPRSDQEAPVTKPPTPFQVHESGAWLHGTKADLTVGDLLVPGQPSNFEAGRVANHVYVTATLDAATWGAELAAGEGRGRIYLVEPSGTLEDDPNVTDKKFPGNPTRSYRTREPVRVVGELLDWQGHSAQQLQAMRDGLADLQRRGLAVIDD